METPPKYEIFISYRRDGGVDYARMIYLELKGRGYNTFFDFNSLRSGKFNENIFKAIDECRYFILVLSNGALDRCVNEDDWVRHEIEYALSKGKEIIPICPSGSMRGFPETMPESFEPLRHIQISRLEMDDLFDKSFDKIVEDRFEDSFRLDRSPVSVDTAITVRSFKKVGLGVAGVVLLAAVVVGYLVLNNSSDAETNKIYETYHNMSYEEIMRLFDEYSREPKTSHKEIFVKSPDGQTFQGPPFKIAIKLASQDTLASLVTNNISSLLSRIVLAEGALTEQTLDSIVRADLARTDKSYEHAAYRQVLTIQYSNAGHNAEIIKQLIDQEGPMAELLLNPKLEELQKDNEHGSPVACESKQTDSFERRATIIQNEDEEIEGDEIVRVQEAFRKYQSLIDGMDYSSYLDKMQLIEKKLTNPIAQEEINWAIRRAECLNEYRRFLIQDVQFYGKVKKGYRGKDVLGVSADGMCFLVNQSQEVKINSFDLRDWIRLSWEVLENRAPDRPPLEKDVKALQLFNAAVFYYMHGKDDCASMDHVKKLVHQALELRSDLRADVGHLIPPLAAEFKELPSGDRAVTSKLPAGSDTGASFDD